MINVYLSYNLLDPFYKVNKTRVLNIKYPLNSLSKIDKVFKFPEKINFLCSVSAKLKKYLTDLDKSKEK